MNGWSSNRPLEPADRQGSVQKNRSRSVGIWLVLPSHRPALDCLVGGCFLAAESLFPMRSGQRSVYHAIPTAFDSTFHCLHSESHTDSPRSRRRASRTLGSFARYPAMRSGSIGLNRDTDGASGTFHLGLESKASCCPGWLCGLLTVGEASRGVARREVDLGNLVKMKRRQPIANVFLGPGGRASTLQ